MLKTLIGRSSQPEGRTTLSLYVIAVSFPKMLRRMHGSRITKCYFDCLQRLKSKTFEFVEQPNIVENDKNPDRHFIRNIRTLPNTLNTDISNLRKAAEESNGGVTEPCEIYNENTYMEFHGLLCELVERFNSSLEEVKKLQAKMPSTASGLLDSEKIKSALLSVMILGQYLKAMVRSAALEKHLRTISHLLDVDSDDGKSSMATTDEDAEDDEDADDPVLKPYSIYQGQPTLPWQSYRDWLRLTTMYFDAIAILNKHVRSFSSSTDLNFNIKILAPSLPDQKMLPWKELLRHKVYFPELPNDPDQPSSEELITFLTSDFDTGQITEATRNEKVERTKGKKDKCTRVGVGVDLVVKSVRDFINQLESVIAANGIDLGDTKAIDSIIGQLKSLNNCASPGCGEFTTTIFEQLQALKCHCPTPQLRLTRSKKILDMLETLRGHSSLYQKLKEGTPLSRGDTFSGTRHCEAWIASLNNLFGRPELHDSPLVEILSEFAVSPIFMPFSNVCQFHDIGHWTNYRGV